MWEMRSETAHGHCLKHATHGIRCSSAGAGGYQTALHYCGCPLLDWGWIACIRCKAPSTRDQCSSPLWPCLPLSVHSSSRTSCTVWSLTLTSSPLWTSPRSSYLLELAPMMPLCAATSGTTQSLTNLILNWITSGPYLDGSVRIHVPCHP